MNLLELFIIAVGLSMDAFAVAICKGLSIKQLTFKKALTVGLYFGIFQGLMPLIGYLAASRFAERIKSFDHWIAFILLVIIGVSMIKESFGKEEQGEVIEEPLTARNMLPLAVATSIDALAAGVSFAFLQVRIAPAITFIGICTLVLSMVGVKVGNVFGLKYKSKAELAGGIILIIMGTKILLEHTVFV